MLTVDEIPEVSCAACEHDSKARIFATLVCYISKHYDHIDPRAFLEMLDVAAKAARRGE